MSRFLPRFHALPILLSFTFLSGCSYIHFGRIDKAHLDAKLATENSDLRVEKKMLQQELAIAQKENNTLRTAIERQPSASGDLVAKLNETTRELAALRADYSRLQSQRQKLENAADAHDNAGSTMAAMEQIADLKTKLTDNEDRLASTLKLYTQLQDENNRLRTAVDQTHAENAELSKQLAQTTAQYSDTRDALAQLNTEFLAQKAARSRAEQDAQALRAQLRSLLERSHLEAAPAGSAPSLASAREGSASGAAVLAPGQPVDAVQGGVSATATLTTKQGKVQGAMAPPQPAASAPTPVVAPTPAPAADATPASQPGARTYVVQEGDTIESLAEKFYGRRDKWRLIYAANNTQLSGGRPLKPGMELQIPSDE